MQYLPPSLLLIIALLLPVNLFAKPTAVILYPSGATVSERITILSGAATVTLLLPQVAIPESIKLALQAGAKQKITGIAYESILPESSGFYELRELISRLEQEIGGVNDQIQSQTLALRYWKTQQDLPVKTLADAREMGIIIREESIVLLQETTRLQQQKTELTKQLQEAQNQLQKKIGNNQRNWQVQAQLSQPATTDINLTYSYRIHRASWQSDYSLNALPGEKKVEWIWTARIMQQTGIDWNGINLKIATSEPVFTLTPPPKRPWLIQVEQLLRGRSNLKMMAMPQAVTMDAVAEQKTTVPTRTAGQLFDIYDLGHIDIAAGKESRIKIRQGDWQAKFTYLTRPLLSQQVFLQADLDLTKGFIPLPTGMASIQVDGVHVGRRNFSLHEKRDVRMSFGSDPGIVVAVQTDHIAGEKGLLSRKNTYAWNWEISLVNHKNFAVDLRVEDSYPHSGHEKIVLEESFTPPLPTREKDQLVWNMTLPPQGEQLIKYGFYVTYPEDMSVSLGR